MSGHYDYLVAQRDAVLSTARMSPVARARALGKRLYMPLVSKPQSIENATPRDLRVRRIRGEKAKILTAVAEAFNVTFYELRDAARTRRICYPRFAAALLLRDKLDLSFPQIARALNRKDHTSAQHEVRRGAHLLFTDPEWAALYRVAEHALDQQK